MSSSIVGSNSHRKLDVDEFRGFTLADKYAPLIFINAADSKAAQMFTLVHELAHLWLGESGISDIEAGRIPDKKNEEWCNKVAAELLMPISATREAFQKETPVREEIQRLAKLFKVSSLVVVRLECAECGTEVTGEFELCPVCRLDAAFRVQRHDAGGQPTQHGFEIVVLSLQLAPALLQGVAGARDAAGHRVE